MIFQKRRKYIWIIFSILILFMSIAPQFQSLVTLPSEQRITVGEKLSFDLMLPERILSNLSVYVESELESQIELNGELLGKGSFNYLAGNPVIRKPGKISIEMKLFDLIPIKKVSVNAMPELKVYPGGQSIGVLLQSQGVIIVGFSPIVTDGKPYFPARELGIREGDVILSINGVVVKTDRDIANIIDEAGRKNEQVELEIRRDGKTQLISVDPVYCMDTNRYRTGMFVRDTTAGVGTLTFYEEQTGYYGALGHVITDADTNLKISVGKGRIVPAAIKGIQQGRRGKPGEKIGSFIDDDSLVGNIEKNTDFGIFGRLSKPMERGYYDEPIPVAIGNQIQPGKAEILTVVRGTEIQKFEIEIERVFNHSRPSNKGMIIRITDKDLLSSTGGIVQGMSGSPIIQDGRLVGAVTHVFVNDPTRGYGILAEWMIYETGITNSQISYDAGSVPASFFLCKPIV